MCEFLINRPRGMWNMPFAYCIHLIRALRWVRVPCPSIFCSHAMHTSLVEMSLTGRGVGRYLDPLINYTVDLINDIFLTYLQGRLG